MGRQPAFESDETFFFRGEMRTTKEIAEFSKSISPNTVYHRLKDGWDPERAILPDLADTVISKEWEDKDLLVSFPHPLGGIIPSMQPICNKPYIAYHNRPSASKQSLKHFFIIYLENGKPLIVYPHDFQILGEAPSEQGGSISGL